MSGSTGRLRAGCTVAAVDLGASSGRVIRADVGADRLELVEVHRFANGAVTAEDGSLHWDAARLGREILRGLRACGAVDAVGVDSWAVDYGLLDAGGALLGDPFCYRDDRTDAVQDDVLSAVGEPELYAATGLARLPFNTIYQLRAETRLPEAATLLLIPDLVGHWLCGAVGAEATNASTTQLYDLRTRGWATGIAERVGIPPRILPAIREPGEVLGPLLPGVADETGLAPATPVVAVGSHDTASAVVAVPFADPRRAAYISSGTWSLAGVELDAPVLAERARLAHFTNEGGVDATIRFLRNIAGLWVLSETLRGWGRTDADLPELLDAAAQVGPGGPVVDLEAEVFIAPGDMPARIDAACRRTGQEGPDGPAAVVRCVLDSLALSYRRTVRAAAELSGQPVEVVHIVGGGSRNELLCRLSADACGVPVLAGPVEAAAIGNALVQARSLGVDLPDLAAMRALVARTQPATRYEPGGDPSAWAALESRLHPGSTPAHPGSSGVCR